MGYHCPRVPHVKVSPYNEQFSSYRPPNDSQITLKLLLLILLIGKKDKCISYMCYSVPNCNTFHSIANHVRDFEICTRNYPQTTLTTISKAPICSTSTPSPKLHPVSLCTQSFSSYRPVSDIFTQCGHKVTYNPMRSKVSHTCSSFTRES